MPCRSGLPSGRDPAPAALPPADRPRSHPAVRHVLCGRTRMADSPLMLEPYRWYPRASAHVCSTAASARKLDDAVPTGCRCPSCAPAQDIRRVQRHPHPTLFQVARLPGQAQAGLEHRPHLVVENQLGTKHCSVLLAKGRSSISIPSSGCQVGAGLSASLTLSWVQQQRGGQQAGRNAVLSAHSAKSAWNNWPRSEANRP